VRIEIVLQHVQGKFGTDEVCRWLEVLEIPFSILYDSIWISNRNKGWRNKCGTGHTRSWRSFSAYNPELKISYYLKMLYYFRLLHCKYLSPASVKIILLVSKGLLTLPLQSQCSHCRILPYNNVQNPLNRLKRHILHPNQMYFIFNSTTN